MNPTNVCTEVGQNCISFAARVNECLIAGSNGNSAHGMRAQFRLAIARLIARMQFWMQFITTIASRMAQQHFGVQFGGQIVHAITTRPLFLHFQRNHPRAALLPEKTGSCVATTNTTRPLITRPRLSVTELTPEHFQEVINLSLS
jgi:hypothetical protein